ncbi:glycosyltransferase [Christiangramia sp. ASW11-125]|uniref:glycosyltransferase n=1 Tax=Christiangramia sp. ASW11-125 TaxID=3400701 RepID=UPI003AAAD5D3
MRILQLIDTLHPGGAEQMAVNYANALTEYGIDSQICVTRENGLLKEKIDPRIKFHFLNKRKVYDLAALYKLLSIIRKEKIDIVHAHSSSWFFAALCKYTGGNFKLMWHDHYGNSEFLENRSLQPLKFFSKKIDGIISVDEKLKKWGEENLNSEQYISLNNFVKIPEINNQVSNPLQGDSEFNLICVANLRPQKDHYTLLEAFKIVNEKFKVSLHLLGKKFQDDYSVKLLKKINNEENVYYYGSMDNIFPYLYYSDIGLLSSNSEALPLVLLEYGYSNLPVVCTDVGSCAAILGNHGSIIEPSNPKVFAESIMKLLENGERRLQEGAALNRRIKQLYSIDKVVSAYINFTKSL